MPEDYLRCIAQGGKVRSKRINDTQYLPICFKDGKSFEGEVKTYKKLKNRKSK
jgi:hypothetical protein